MEPGKDIAFGFPTSKEILYLKACWTNMPYALCMLGTILIITGVHYKEYAMHTVVVQTSLSRFDITTTLVHGPEYH